jgi:hypothetical protein
MKYNLILISALFILYSCGSDEEKQLSKTFDSLKTALETTPASDSLINGTEPLDNIDILLSEFGKRYSISSDWSKLNKNNRAVLKRELTGKFIIIPVTKSQVKGIQNGGFADTSVVFTGNSSNSFVFDIDGSLSIIEKIGSGRNGLLLMKIKKISDSMKLYLVKKDKDFQHSEYPVTEFDINCDLIDAAEIILSDSMLLKKFSLKEF